MKKACWTLLSSFMIMLLVSFSALAKPVGYNPSEYTSVDEYSTLLPESAKTSRAHGSSVMRGNFFSGADLQIINEGNGKIGALAVAHTDTKVEEAYITIYLDRLDEGSNKWVNVMDYEKDFLAKDYPDGLLNPSVNISFTNQKKGYYYRLRGVFSAVRDGKFEGFSVTTDGIMID